MDDLIHKYISNKYSSGINKENVYKLNEEANKISRDNVVSLWKEKKLTVDNSDKSTELKKILVLCHGGAIAEIMNNILYRLKKNVTIQRVVSENTGLFVVQIYQKEISKKKDALVDNDLIFNFKLFNDITHLNINDDK